MTEEETMRAAKLAAISKNQRLLFVLKVSLGLLSASCPINALVYGIDPNHLLTSMNWGQPVGWLSLALDTLWPLVLLWAISAVQRDRLSMSELSILASASYLTRSAFDPRVHGIHLWLTSAMAVLAVGALLAIQIQQRRGDTRTPTEARDA